MNRSVRSRDLKLTHEIADNQQGSPLLRFIYAFSDSVFLFLFIGINANAKITVKIRNIENQNDPPTTKR